MGGISGSSWGISYLRDFLQMGGGAGIPGISLGIFFGGRPIWGKSGVESLPEILRSCHSLEFEPCE